MGDFANLFSVGKCVCYFRENSFTYSMENAVGKRIAPVGRFVHFLMERESYKFLQEVWIFSLMTISFFGKTYNFTKLPT